jgi:hypothetical protein
MDTPPETATVEIRRMLGGAFSMPVEALLASKQP